MGPKWSLFHYLTILSLSERPLTLHPGGLLCQGQRREFGKRRVGPPSRVPRGRCREKRHERSVGDDEEGPESANTEGGKPGIRSAAEALPRLLPCFVSRSQRLRPHGLLSGEVTGTRWVAHAALACLCFALSVPTSSRRLGPAGCRCGLLPTWPFASPLSPSLFVLLLSWPFLSAKLAFSALSSCKRLWIAAKYPQLSLAFSPRE